jgi:hypothetical protein
MRRGFCQDLYEIISDIIQSVAQVMSTAKVVVRVSLCWLSLFYILYILNYIYAYSYRHDYTVVKEMGQSPLQSKNFAGRKGFSPHNTEAQFIVPAWVYKVDYAIGSFRTGLSWYIGWRAGTTTLCLSRLYPPIGDYEFGYSTFSRLFVEDVFHVGHPTEA